MENLEPIAKKLFDEIPQSTWSGKNLLYLFILSYLLSN